MIGRTLAHYKITTAIGAGGMGEVYRATDTRLGRDVALKVLPSDMAHDAERLARFQREARAVASLNHPNIVTIFSVEESEGIHFLTMELVEGQSLDRLIPSGGLPAHRIIEIACALSEALAAAHDKGIIHRDLKPANVMVTSEGRVKVLDFGLAKETRATSHADATLTSASNTKAGVVMGTPAYMSPEQISGRAVDHRTDIFSLGILLYEMSTGRRPFEGQSSAELASAILRDTPSPVTDSRADLPAELGRIIQRCLEKSAADRFPSAQEVRYGLRGVTTGSAAIRTPTVTGERLQTQQDSGSTRAGELWVAVLAFKNTGGDPELAALAEGLTEDITTGLSRFSCLHVIARNSTLTAGDRSMDLRAVGKDLGARYVMEGAVRKSGSNVRISSRVLDAVTGEHLWAENYDRDLKAASLFELQDDITARIVSTVGDAYGVLPRAMAAVVRRKPVESATPYEAVLRQFGYYQLLTSEEHKSVRDCLERAVEKEPDYADAWASLALMYLEEFKHGFNVRPDPLGRASEATRRALALDSVNQRGYYSLASTRFFQKDFQGFRQAVERLLSLNPLDGGTRAWMGLLTAYSGEWDRGLAMAAEALALNPNHPGWFRFAEFWGHYRKQEYQQALEIARTINMPSYFYYHVAVAGACGQLGRREEAEKALQDLLKIKPDFPLAAREELGKWLDSNFVEHFIEGLRKAGLEIPEPGAPTKTDSRPPIPTAQDQTLQTAARPHSASARTGEGFWVAVLPFKFRGEDASLVALAGGMAEGIITGLSRFSYLRVIAQGSTAKYASESGDVRAIGRELGARYVMEGNIRQGGPNCRVAVQLVDATSGAHLWAETFDRPFKPETLLELEDDLVPRIVSTLADQDGILPLSMSEALRGKTADELTPHEAMIRSFGFFKRFTPEEHAEVRGILEAAVRHAPEHGDCWAMLSHMYCNEYWSGFNPRPDPLARGLQAARRAVDAAPSNHLSYWALALPLYFQREFQEFRVAAERCIELNRLDGSTVAFMGALMAYSGDWERGTAIAEPASALNPNHAGWHRVLHFYNAYRKAEYSQALAAALRLNAPGSASFVAARAAAYGQLGQREQAQKAIQDLLALDPDFAAQGRIFYSKFLPPQLTNDLMDGLRKAGLNISGEKAVISSPSTAKSDVAGEHSQAPGAERAETVAIAVLPFSDMSPAQDQQYLCEGMAEEIMNALVGVRGIRVASRTSAFRAKEDGGDLAVIARALGVGHVLEGSVRTSGSRLRVTAQLTDVASGYQLWSERFDREAVDVFAVQDEIAAGVVQAVKSRLTSGIQAIRHRPQAGNLDAYRAFLKGQFLRFTKEDIVGARLAFEEAIRLDPSHAPSWIGLAEVTFIEAIYNVTPARAAYAAAKKFLATAASLEAESADSVYATGLVAYGERDWPLWESSMRRAIELQPTHVRALSVFGIVLCARQRPGEAMEYFERACAADPLAAYPHALAGAGMVAARRPQESLRHFEDAFSFEKDHMIALWGFCMAKFSLGCLEEAIAAAERGLAVTHRGAFFVGLLGWTLAAAGRTSEAQALLQELNARPPEAPTVVSKAWLLAALGEADAAFDVLARAEAECQTFVIFSGYPGFDPLRNDPRFAALLNKLDRPAGK